MSRSTVQHSRASCERGRECPICWPPHQASQAVARLVLEAKLSKPSPTTAEILGLLMQAEEIGYARGLGQAQSLKPRRYGAESCTVCGVEWVDTAAGFDTCAGCLARMQS